MTRTKESGKMVPTIDDVMNAFDALGGARVQRMALQKALENQGWHVAVVINAIDAALKAGALVMTPQNSLTKP